MGISPSAESGIFRVEINSKLESFLSIVVLCHGIFSVLVSIGMYLAFSHFLPNHAMTGFYYICAVHGSTFLVFLLLWKSFRSFYQFDPQTRCIDHVWQAIGINYRTKFLEFDQIEVVSATGLRRQTTVPPIDKWFDYSVCLLDKQGGMHEFAKICRDLPRMNAVAAEIAKITGCALMECPKESVIKTEKSHEKIKLELVHLPIKAFSGNLLPFEVERPLLTLPLVLAAVVFSFSALVIGTITLTFVFSRLQG